MEKKLSKYYKKMILSSIIAVILAIVTVKIDFPTLSAVLFTASFILWFVAEMAPDNEKYKS